MNRFEAASDGELQSFADNQKSLNTQRSTKTTMCLLEQYKVEAPGRDVIIMTSVVIVMTENSTLLL